MYSQNISRVKIIRVYRLGRHSLIIFIYKELGLPHQHHKNLFLISPMNPFNVNMDLRSLTHSADSHNLILLNSEERNVLPPIMSA